MSPTWHPVFLGLALDSHDPDQNKVATDHIQMN